MRKQRLALLASVGAMSLMAGGALAQEAALEEIVVTARKQAESITQTPVSVAALSAEALSQKGADNFQDIARYAPGLNFVNQNVNRNDRSFYRFQTRGIYEGTTVFIDGVAVAGANTGGINDTAQVEIINGPQSAAFGRASFGGAINFVTKRPSFDFGAEAQATVASHETYEVVGMVEGPLIGDVLAGKLMARRFERGAIYDNFSVGGGLGEQSTTAFVGSLLFEPNDNASIYYRGAYWIDDDGPSAQGSLTPADYNCSTPTAVGGARNYICGEISSVPANRLVQFTSVTPQIINYVTGRVGPGEFIGEANDIDHFGLRRKAQHHAVTWDYDLPWQDATLSGNLGYATDDRSFITDTSLANGYLRPTPGTGAVPQPNPFYRNPTAANRVGFADLLPVFSRTAAGSDTQVAKSGEVRVALPTDRKFSALLGVSYLETERVTLTNAFNNDGFQNPGLKTRTLSETVGLFGSVSYRFDFGLKLIAEGRMQRDEIQSTVMAPGGTNDAGTFNSKTPRLIAQYQPNDNLNFYASYSEGVRPGGFNSSLFSRDQRIIDYIQRFEAPGITKLIPEEKVKMSEIGFKGAFLDRRLNVMVAAYKGNWENRQVTQNVNYPGTPPGSANPIPATRFNVTPSGGAADLWGMEFQGRFQATENLSFEGTYAYAESETKFDICSVCVLLTGQANPVGQRFGGYPAHSGSFSAAYERELNADYTGFARVDYSYRGKIYADQTHITWAPASHTVNARVGVQSERYGLELFGRNIFDDDTPTSLARNADAYTTTINTLVVSPPDPATFGVKVTARY